MDLVSLASYVSNEFNIQINKILLLRHSNRTLQGLNNFGVKIDEYTAMQPINSKYDFYHPEKEKISCVIVIANDLVESVQIVDGIEAVGTNYSITSQEYQRFDRSENKKEVFGRRYHMHRISSKTIGLEVYGWKNRSRTPIQRYDSGFFAEILIDQSKISTEILSEFDEQVQKAINLSQQERLDHINQDKNIFPKKISITTFVFERSPYVVAEALFRAKGICQRCKKTAPFRRRSNQSPFLEVHHLISLSKGGKDTLENVIAVCPNCHREIHHG